AMIAARWRERSCTTATTTMTRTESTTGTTRSRVTAPSCGHGRRCSSVLSPLSAPVLHHQCPALVVAPPAGDLQVPRREPFATKAKTANERARRFIVRLDVRLHAMKMQRPEGPAQCQREA